MKIVFEEKDRTKILASIEQALGGRELAKMVHFTVGSGKLEVTISKMGTSVLTFSEQEHAQGIEYTLSNEKIAFTHKPFKDDVTAKIVKVIETAGGKVT